MIERKFNSLYWHQFALTAGMVLLTLLLLGVSFFTLSYGTTTADKPRRPAVPNSRSR